MRSVLSLVYMNATAVDDELVQTLVGTYVCVCVCLYCRCMCGVALKYMFVDARESWGLAFSLPHGVLKSIDPPSTPSS